MRIKQQKLKEVLVDQKYISQADLEEAEEYSQRYRKPVIERLLERGLITKELLGHAISESFGMPFADLEQNPPTKEDALRIPKKIAENHRVAYFKETDDSIILATDDPIQATRFFKEIRDLFPKKKVKLAFALTEFIEDVFVHYQADLETRIAKLIKTGEQSAPAIIREILIDARTYRVSDIHLEPEEDIVIIRMRIDGVLREVGVFPKNVYENIINRIKVLAQLRVDDHFSAQDGAIRIKQDDLEVDLRISIAPTLNGEKIVFRVLAEYTHGLTFSELGFSAKNEEILAKASKKPFGMVLISGPTGSGKTTTLYSILKTLNSREVNITTIEDPVEYRIAGINQIQVNPQTNITFAKGLRSIVRQDPDVILVGEIRDRETAEIAVNAALSGQLLFSTFHANDAATAIPRLLDMGLEEFLLASTLELIVSQRLVRRVCESCKVSISHKRVDLEKNYPYTKGYFSGETVRLYEGKGCSVCSDKKFRGRIAVFEILNISSGVKDLILRSGSANQIWEKSQEEGGISMWDDGIDKVKQGITTIEELVRVVPPPEIDRVYKNKKNETKRRTTT